MSVYRAIIDFATRLAELGETNGSVELVLPERSWLMLIGDVATRRNYGGLDAPPDMLCGPMQVYTPAGMVTVRPEPKPACTKCGELHCTKNHPEFT